MTRNEVRVLVVEDDDSLAKMLCLLLEMKGLEARVALSGEQALQSFLDQPAELVIVDLRLPGLCGLEVLRRLRGLSPGVGLIALSGGGPESRPAALAAGADHYLRKPFDVCELQETCLALISGARAGLEGLRQAV